MYINKTCLCIIMLFLCYNFSWAQPNKLDYELLNAVRKDDYKKIEQLIEKGANVNIFNGSVTPLHCAVKRKNGYEIVKLLIKHGADVNKKNHLNVTPILGIPLNKKGIKIARVLVKNGANINAKSKYEGTLLHTVCELEDYEMAEALIKLGANVNVHDDLNITPLHIACKNDRNYDLAKLIIESKADLNKKLDEYINRTPEIPEVGYSIGKGLTALHLSILLGNENITKLLVEKGADLNQQISEKDINHAGYTALHFASMYNDLSLAKLLIDNNADTTIKTKDGLTPIAMAKNYSSNEVYLYLQNPKLNEIFALYSLKEYEKVFQLIQRNPELLKIKLSEGLPLLHLSVKDDNKIVFNKLVEKNSYINVLDKSGQTALLYAINSGHVYFAEKLIKAGANINTADEDGYTPLYIAKSRSYIHLVNLLISKKAISGSIKPRLIIPTSHTDDIKSIVVSSDGKYVATGSEDETIKLWEISSGKLIRTFKGHKYEVNSVLFSQNNKFLFSASGDETIKQWDILTGKVIKTYSGHSDNINSIAISPNGKYIISGSDDETLKLWEISSSKAIRTFSAHKNGITSVAFSSDGKLALSASKDETIKLWDLKTGNEIKTFESHKTDVECISISPKGKYFISSGGRHKAAEIFLWDIATGELVRTFDGHNNVVDFVSFCPTGKYIISASSDETIKLWESHTGKELLNIETQKDVYSIAFSRDGQSVFASCDEDPISILNISNGEKIKAIKEHILDFKFVSFSSDGKDLVFGVDKNQNKELIKWDLYTGNKLYKIKKNNLKENKSFFDKLEWRFSDFYSPDKRYIVSPVDYGRVILHNDEGYPGLEFTCHVETSSSVIFSPDSKYVFFAGEVDNWGDIILIDTSDFRKTSHYKGHLGYVNSIALSPDLNFILSGADDETVKLWDITSFKEIHTFKGHRAPVKSVCFSPNGKLILSGATNKTAKLWNKKTGKEIATLYLIDSTDWIVSTPSGLFDASPNTMKLLHYVVGTEIIEIEQLKDRYYEPGLLSKLSGHNKSPLRDIQGLNNIKLYPEIELSPINKGIFNIKLKRREGGIGKVKMYINGKEVIEDARPNNTDNSKELLNIPISIDKFMPYFIPNEENVISVKAYNSENWLISRAKTIYYTPKVSGNISNIPEIYIVSIGVSDYTGSEIDLRFAAKDAEDISLALQLGANRLFGVYKTHSYLLCSPFPSSAVDAKKMLPTKKNIKSVFKEIQSKIKAKDIIVVYLAGHGLSFSPGNTEGDFYYLTQEAYSGDRSIYHDNAIRKKTTLKSSEFVNLLTKLPAQKQVLIIDACQSGKAAENLMVKRNMPSSTIRALERMKDRTGMHIITGSTADAPSYESNQFGQGLLTYSLLEGIKGTSLRKGQFIDIATWFQKARDRVPVLAKNIGGIQSPVIFSPFGAESFDIGKLTTDDKAQIPLAKSKPMFVASVFLESNNFADILNLEENVDEKLSELTSKGKDAPLILIDTKEFPGSYGIRGQYVIKKNEVVLNAKILKNKVVYAEFQLIGNKNDINKLSVNIIKNVLNEIK